MERTAYALLEGMEASWWYQGRIAAIRAVLKHAGVQKVSTALDYGAGYGGMRSTFGLLAEHTDAFEPDGTARNAASKRGYRNIFADEESAFKNSYDLIGLFDVLEHIEDDKAFLMRALPVLSRTDKISGRLVITVPAFMTLWGAHDVAHHHFRRYTKGSLRKLLTNVGYEVEYVSYWNCAMLIPASILRFAGRSGEGGLTPPQFVNAILHGLVNLEAFILQYVSLPFGLSIVVLVKKAASGK